MNELSTMAIAAIKVGERHRRNMGDIAGLAASIADVGLLHPPVVTPARKLVAGERRLLAAKELGWKTVPVTVVDLDAVVRGEFVENAARKNFTMSEAVAIKRALEPLERKAAKERQTAALKRGDKKPVVESFHNGGKTRDKLAAVSGISGRTLEKAEAIVAAAEADDARIGEVGPRHSSWEVG